MPTDSLNQILNFGIPALLIIVAIGFIYIKFIKPWVIPMLQRFGEWAKGKETTDSSIKEISYE